MPTYINTIPITMNIIDNTTNIPTPPFRVLYLYRREGAVVDEQN